MKNYDPNDWKWIDAKSWYVVLTKPDGQGDAGWFAGHTEQDAVDNALLAAAQGLKDEVLNYQAISCKLSSHSWRNDWARLQGFNSFRDN